MDTSKGPRRRGAVNGPSWRYMVAILGYELQLFELRKSRRKRHERRNVDVGRFLLCRRRYALY